MDEEGIALEFAANVEEAVASVRELAASAQDLAATAKEATDGVAGMAAPAAEAGDAIKGVADSSTAATGALAGYSDEQKQAAAAAGDLAAAQARVKAASAEVKDAVSQLAGIQSAAGKDSAEYAAQLDVVTGAMQKQAAAAEQLKGVQEQQAAAAAQAKTAAEETATAQEATVTASDSAAAAATTAGTAQEGAAAKADAAAAGGLARYKMALVGVGIGAAVAVDAAGKFQDSTTHLVTDAGESAKNLALVQQGILSVSAATGTSASDITNAAYHIESAGMHGASGLAVLKVAAEGAKVGGADLDTVSKTLVGTLNAYGMTSSNAATQTQLATSMMNQLIATVGAGDMKMQDLASSLSSVAPLAAAAHIQFADVGGAIATMTAQGMSAQQATQDLSNTIRAMSNPNNVAINEMQQMGLSAQTVSSQLGQRGLFGTLTLVTQAITQHMGPSGMVLQSAFNNATNAAKDAQAEIKAMPPSLQQLADQFMNGSVTSKQWTADLKALPPVQAHLMAQFATTAEKAHSFNTLLAAGGPAAQTYTAALAKVMGGATGLNTALMLTGGRLATFGANEATVYNAGVKAGNAVDNWSTIQGTFNQKLATAKASLQDAGITLGTVLLPAVTAVIGPVAHFLALVASNRAASIALAVVVGGILAGAIGLKLAKSVKDASEGIRALGDGAEWLIGKLTGASAAGEASAAATEAQAAATEALTAAKEESVGATEAAAVAQGELDVAMDANPIGLIILAIVALIAIIVLVVTHLHFFAHVFDEVRHAVATAGHDIARGFDAVRHAVSGAFDAVRHAAATVGDDIVRPFRDAYEWVLRNWKNIAAWLVDPIGMAVFEIRTHLHAIEAAFTQLGHDTEAIFDGARHDIAAIATGIGHDVESQFDSARHEAAVIFDGLRHDIAAIVVGIPGDIRKQWDTIRHDAAAFGDGLLHDVTSAVTSLWHNLTATTSQGASQVADFFRKLPGEVLGFLKSLPGDMEHIGEDIVNGLIHGVEAMAGQLLNQVQSLASNVEKFFTNPLSIFSPSRVMYGHGRNYVQGIIDGIRSKAAELAATAGGLGAGLATGPAYAASAAAPAGGGGTSLHLSMPMTVQAGSGYDTPQFRQYLQGEVQEAVLRYDQLNAGNGLSTAWGR